MCQLVDENKTMKTPLLSCCFSLTLSLT